MKLIKSILVVGLIVLSATAEAQQMRSYTVREIDSLRQACENKYLFGTYKFRMTVGMSRTYSEVEKSKIVEEMVRTFMLAGKTADDLTGSEP